MCGLLGIISAGNLGVVSNTTNLNHMNQSLIEEYYPEEPMLDSLFLTSSLRGINSSGLFASKKDSKVLPEVFKRVFNPLDFIHTKQYEQYRNSHIIQQSFIIGHTRHTTSGGNSITAAHPHQVGPITLVHNGTLFSWKNLTSKYTPISDSHAITCALAEADKEDQDPSVVLEQLYGSYALIWHNVNTDMLYIARNDERPLFFYQKEDTFLISSEGLFLDFALKRNLTREIDSKIQQFESNWLYNLQPGDEVLNKTKLQPKKQAKTKIYTYKPAAERLKKDYGLKVGDTIWFQSDSFNITESGSSNMSAFIIKEDGTIDQTLKIRIYSCKNAKELHDCDILQGTIRDVYTWHDKGEVNLEISTAPASIKGYIYNGNEGDSMTFITRGESFGHNRS